MRRAIAVYFSSRVPVTSSTGIASCDTSPHIGSIDAHAEAAQARREEFRREPAAVGQAGRVGGNAREHRLREPGLEERAHAVALDALGEHLVGVDACGPLRGVGDAGRRAHEHERAARDPGGRCARRKHSRPPIE